MVTINRESMGKESKMTKHMLLCLHHQFKVVILCGNCQALVCFCQCVYVAVTMISFHTTNIHIQRKHDTPSSLSIFIRSASKLALMCDACISECCYIHVLDAVSVYSL